MRSQNQDSVFAVTASVGKLPNLLIVADGMGGHKAGDYASRQAIRLVTDTIRKSPYQNPALIVTDAIRQANAKLYEESVRHEEYRGMGTTFTLAYVDNKLVHIYHVGDSRLYLLHDTLKQLTLDHSYVEEMYRKGLLSRDSAEYHQKKNIITRALGGNDYIVADIYEEPVSAGDIILLCSDGLTNMVPDERISAILSSEGSLEQKAESLIFLANQNGGQDNISVVLAVC